VTPLAEVMAQITAKANYGEQATGRSLEDEFSKPPFGWDFEAVRAPVGHEELLRLHEGLSALAKLWRPSSGRAALKKRLTKTRNRSLCLPIAYPARPAAERVSRNPLKEMVGARGIEPLTPTMSR
jgi:hypothetical protein